MKRDIDLARQLLLDIEGRGADCSVSVLRTGGNYDTEERVRYHLRLLIDAGLLKEVDRAANGVPCVRLTDPGHELIELSRSAERWRHAKRACHERTGGLSLAVIRAILTRWALVGQPISRRRAYYAAPYDGIEARGYEGYELSRAYRIDPYAYDVPATREGVSYVRVRPPYRNGWRHEDSETIVSQNGEADLDGALPDYLI
jgi:hypothetical protein